MKFNALGGTNFALATLHKVDFSGADIKHTHFMGADILRCRFQQVKNHHLALTIGTPLALHKVRTLVVIGISVDKDFSKLNLQGLDFSDFDLSSVDFSNANLNQANFSGCQLQAANLSEVNALGACFNDAQMTAACIKNWNIDTNTQLDNIDCAYVYLAEGKQQRNPPEGDFAVNEFSKLYQQIADTIDFIAHNSEELDALLMAIEKLKTEAADTDIYVQNIERKADSIVVKVKSSVGVDREQIYKQIKKAQKKYIKQLKAEHQQQLLAQDKAFVDRENELITGHNDLLAELLKGSLQSHSSVSIHNQQESSLMKDDHSRHQSLKGDNNNNVNFGDNSTLSNRIEQLPASDIELKELLRQLMTLIESSGLASEDVQDALDETKNIVAARSEPPEQQQNLIAKALRALRRVGYEMSDKPEKVLKYSELLEKIGGMF
ncbi:MAG: hypothetical protein methR_P0902 [Methyloprofundus sp.]|nr:MAG: hypothetical protein methR_P0902 [Methyloprofundus sp.]